MAKGPLNGIRILDLTHVWAGPLATRMLADLGAMVVKIEAPYSRGPRDWRGATPLGGWIGGEPGDEPWNINAIFVKLQRNKQSASIDLKTDAGRATFLELVKVADVVIENFTARAMLSLCLGYEQLAEANPKIIYVVMPGYGASGPYRDRVAFGPAVEPMSGLTNVVGYGPDEPRNTAMALPDAVAGVNATAAVVTALRRRERTGQGAFVEMSLHEAGVALCGPFLIEHQLGGRVERIGNRHPAMAPNGVYRAAGEDDWIAIACRHDGDWRALCDVIGGALSPQADLETRHAEHDAIDAAIRTWTQTRNKVEAADALQAVGVPAGPVYATPDMAADPQVQERGFFVPLEAGTPMPGNPVKMDTISPDDWTPCPRLGADNRGVLRDWLGYGDERIDQLERERVLVDKPPG
jgi:crotonobetainyl-CoA:carnitine CoA-transferase CaiB-like acyl-CoA transferase